MSMTSIKLQDRRAIHPSLISSAETYKVPGLAVEAVIEVKSVFSLHKEQC